MSAGATEDPAAVVPARFGLVRAVDGLVSALTFLTILPLRSSSAELPAAAGWFPAVGAFVGLTAGGALYGAETILGRAPGAVVGIGAMIALTGALHLDGLADYADGLGVRGDASRRLAAMRDSSIGTYGALALLVWLALAVTALAGLTRSDAFLTLIVACCVGRWGALVHARLTEPARSEGLGASFRVTPLALGLGTATAVAVALTVAGPLRGACALSVTATASVLMSAWARRAVGGRTGDTLGTTVAVTEVAVFVVLLALARV